MCGCRCSMEMIINRYPYDDSVDLEGLLMSRTDALRTIEASKYKNNDVTKLDQLHVPVLQEECEGAQTRITPRVRSQQGRITQRQ
jgi:hypothetical protein